ncbi:MAG: Tat pathway signal sequence domain protein, partial [Chloroflexi bacterium]|nr:Tat pathway signal sequence domain protein [Chloroflexota bacterium]
WKNDQDQQIAETGSDDLISIDDEHIVDEISINAALANQESQAIDGNGLFHTIVSYVPERFWDDQGTLCVTDFAAARLANGRPHHLWRDENGVWTKTEIPFLQGRVGRSKLVFDSFNTAYVVLPDLRIVAASADSQWTDWRLVFDAADVSIFGEVAIDRQRVKFDDVLSVLYREALDGDNPAPVRLVDFQLGSRAPHQPKANNLLLTP